jgi:DNA-binding HxlR family transcriptional regulator
MAGPMLHAGYDGQVCSIARALEYVGERWTLLILRDLFLGVRRFDVLQRRLGIARNVLTARLEKLVAGGIVERRPYSERPLRHDYRLTEKGLDLWPVLVALLQWGDRYDAPDGPPVLLRHRDCGGTPDSHRICDRCGAALEVRDVLALAGPGASGG